MSVSLCLCVDSNVILASFICRARPRPRLRGWCCCCPRPSPRRPRPRPRRPRPRPRCRGWCPHPLRRRCRRGCVLFLLICDCARADQGAPDAELVGLETVTVQQQNRRKLCRCPPELFQRDVRLDRQRKVRSTGAVNDFGWDEDSAHFVLR